MSKMTPARYAQLSRHERLAFCGELARRKWEKQRRDQQIPGFGFEDTWVTHLFMAGRGCVAPGSMLMLADGSSVPIESFTGGEVASCDSDLIPCTALASKPFIKGVEEMLRIDTCDGNSIEVTPNHLMLTENGWEQAGTALPGTLVYGPIARREDAPRSTHTGEGCQSSCCRRHRRCGEQPPSLTGACLNTPPSPAGVLERILRGSRQDVHASRSVYSRVCQHELHRSKSSSSPSSPSVVAEECCGEPCTCEDPLRDGQAPELSLLPTSNQTCSRSDCGYLQSFSDEERCPCASCGPGLMTSSCIQAPLPPSSCCSCCDPEPRGSLRHRAAFASLLHPMSDPCVSESANGSFVLGWKRITGIRSAGVRTVYDLEVAGTNRYIANGIVHHNTGKTRTGAEWLLQECVRMPGCQAGILAPTFEHGEKVCVHGEAGIMSILADHSVVRWNAYKHQLHFANGSLITLYSSEHQRQLAGPAWHRFWIDEPADLSHGMDAWKKSRPAVRLRPIDGSPARVLITGTPAPVPLVIHIDELHKKHPELYTQALGKTTDNAENLDPMMVQELYERYKGSRYLLQEMEGVLLMQAEGALWDHVTIERQKIPYDHEMMFDEVVVAIDPAVSTDKRADETGIIVLGVVGNIAYVMADYSLRASALDWSRLAYKVAERHGARKIVLEANLAGAMMVDILGKVLHENDSHIKLVRINAKKSKMHRAEPVSALYAASRVYHLTDTPETWGSLDKLEASLTTWEPKDTKSPDRMDAMVHGVDYLLVKGAGGSRVFSSRDSQRGRSGPSSDGSAYRGW